ncbi:MAG: PilZ domain-containing protein [Bdellovibrionales bacterium]|nr:PilZ domain-containing protein [Bdellovibrionales bacterium]
MSMVDRRKDYRLPYHDRVIFSDGKTSKTAYAGNFSRGGLFVLTLDPYPIDTIVTTTFLLPNQAGSMSVKSRLAHIVFDKQRCEVDCGAGLQFLELNESQKSILNLQILNEKMGYLELKKILAPEKPSLSEVQRYLQRMPALQGLDLLELRYRVNRICTLFEPDEISEFSGADTDLGL